MKDGPRFQDQMRRLAHSWEQGEHVLVTGATKSGKTTLARRIDQIRIDRGGFVIVMVAKMRPDQTLLDDYKGWTRWDNAKRIGSPRPSENRVLLWPNTDKAKTNREARAIQRDVFQDAFDRLARVGKWTLHIDEGLYMASPTFMNMADEIAMMHALGRTSGLTIVTLAQRPSHLPLIVYSSASHAFVGRARERADVQRLSELGGRNSAKELQATIAAQGRHDFLWLPVAPDWEPEPVNLRQ